MREQGRFYATISVFRVKLLGMQQGVLGRMPGCDSRPLKYREVLLHSLLSWEI